MLAGGCGRIYDPTERLPAARPARDAEPRAPRRPRTTIPSRGEGLSAGAAPPPVRPRTLRSLQAGRAVAALLVLAHHLGEAFAAEKYFGLPAFALPARFAGELGVCYFFALSGFLIADVHRRDLSRPGRVGVYLKKRAARLYPPYWAVFFGVVAVALVLPAWRRELPDTVGEWLVSVFLLPRGLAVEGGTGAAVIVVAWTLQYELLFYAAFALLILDRRLAVPLTLAVAAVWTAGRGWWPGLEDAFPGRRRTDPVFPFTFLSHDAVPVFLIGAAAAALRPRTGRRAALIAAAAGGGLIAALVAADLGFPWPGGGMIESLDTVLYGAASSALILGLVILEERGADLSGGQFLQAVGDASYSLYLVHMPLLSALCKTAVVAGLTTLPAPWRGTLAAASAVLFAAVCTTSGLLFHRWVELPGVRLARRALLVPPLPRVAPAAGENLLAG